MVAVPSRRSPNWVPSTMPKKPAVPSIPIISAIRTGDALPETKVIEAPKMPAIAQQKVIRSR